MSPRTGGRTYWPGFELEIIDDGQLVETNLLVADKAWTFVDSAGHGHFWKDGYPTLTRVEPGCYLGHGDDCPGDVYYVCPTCGERVRPNMVNAASQWVAGPITYKLTMTGDLTRTWRFDENAWKRLNDAIHAAIEDTLQDEVLVEVQMGG